MMFLTILACCLMVCGTVAFVFWLRHRASLESSHVIALRERIERVEQTQRQVVAAPAGASAGMSPLQMANRMRGGA